MAQLSWSQVEPLVTDARVEGDQAVVTFRCPVSGHSETSRVPLGEGDTARGGLGALLGRVFGGRGRTQSGAEAGKRPTEATMLRAFWGVATAFAFDPSANRIVSIKAFDAYATALSKMLAAAPFATPEARDLLARVLADVAAADGRVDDAERAFLGAVLGRAAEEGLDDLLRLGPPSRAELRASGPLCRLPLYTLAATMALYDELRDPAEVRLLDALALDLELTADERETGERAAREHLLDEAFATILADHAVSAEERAALTALAQRLGVTPDELRQVEARAMARFGAPATTTHPGGEPS
jgi:uncharacterized tellurite resistance protein B-like protein